MNTRFKPFQAVFSSTSRKEKRRRKGIVGWFVFLRCPLIENSNILRQNAREVSTALDLARKFHKYGKPYRIITAYDAQRSQLENALKSVQLPWEDRCFNIDSFQGKVMQLLLVGKAKTLPRQRRGLYHPISRSF